ncbi:MAG: LptF/LptG family permease [Planctomycetes bacterium]|nr:LptF/LptG family permease [Planctomycetota bacterium]
MILQRYIFRELTATFLMAFLILVSVCSIGLIFQMFRTYEAITVEYIIELFPIAMAYMSHWALLVAAAVTGTMVYGRMAAENEIDAVRTSGVHIGRILSPALLFAVFLFGVAFVTNHELGPRGRYAQRSAKSATGLLVLQNPPRGQQVLKIGKYVQLAYLDAHDGVFHDVHIITFDEEGRLQAKYTGSEGRLEVHSGDLTEIHARVTNGYFWQYDKEGQAKAHGSIGRTTPIPLQVENPYQKAKGPADTPGLELVADWARAEGVPRRVLYTELNMRFARSLAPPILFLLGIPIGVLVRKGTRLAGLGAVLPPLLAYFPLYFFGETLADRGKVSAEVGAYGPVAVILVAWLALLFRILRT